MVQFRIAHPSSSSTPTPQPSPTQTAAGAPPITKAFIKKTKNFGVTSSAPARLQLGSS